MTVFDKILSPDHQATFFSEHFQKKPFAMPFQTLFFRGLVSWSLIHEISEKGHNDILLAKKGRLPRERHLREESLCLVDLLEGFKKGFTIVIRHSERSHPQLQSLCEDFAKMFSCTVDLQLYYTPAQEEGFDWHYDLEDVFVIQTTGEKEFLLKKNTVCAPPFTMEKTQQEYFRQETEKTEIRCWLKPGDLLYIPAGYWHKAYAVSESGHLSIGLLRPNQKWTELCSKLPTS